MRWSRGLFRLWVVATVLWLAFTGYVADLKLGPEVSNYLWAKKEAETAEKRAAEPIPEKPSEQHYEALFDPMRDSNYAKQEREFATKQWEILTTDVLWLVALGVSVPVSMLALYWVAAWVIAGFSRPRPQTSSSRTERDQGR